LTARLAPGHAFRFVYLLRQAINTNVKGLEI